MKLNMQPKTIQDYRDLTKVLKLKIVKQSKQLQQMQQKCKKYEDQLGNSMLNLTSRQQLNMNLTKPVDDITQDQLSTLKGKSHVMRKFLRATSLFGITPQAIYRIADSYYTNSIQSDYFRTILQKMALNLTPKEISTLIFIFDENCDGYLTRDDYDNSLHAYEIAMQNKSAPYTQDCLLRFCGLFYAERVDVAKFYDEMKQLARGKNSHADVDLAVFEEQVKKYFAGKMQQREIVGAFNQINLQKQRSIQKKNFLYGINSFTNRLLIEQRSRIQQQPTQFIPPQTQQSLKNSRSLTKPPLINQNTISTISINNNNQSQPKSQLINSAFLHMNPNLQDEHSRQLNQLLREKNVKFADIVMVLTQLPMKSRLSIHQFKKCFKTIQGEFTAQEISLVFKAIDAKVEGSISIQDVINFTLTNYKDTHLIFLLFGKLLQVTSTMPEEFWNSQEFDDFARDISKQKFIEVMAMNCETADPNAWDVVWAYFDKGKGVVSVQVIVDVMKKYFVQ